MDDLKTFAKNDNQQRGLFIVIKAFINDIKMEFGIDKCAKAIFKRGHLTQTTNIDLDINTVIKDIEQEIAHNYLGVNKGGIIQLFFHVRKGLKRAL